MARLDPEQIRGFQGLVLSYYHKHRRNFLWRDDTSPYMVYLSEVMLQQTQTSRVMVLLPAFLEKFPNFEALARASLGEVLVAWQGLGYNRRAKNLHLAAQHIMDHWAGVLPLDAEALETLPGIGKNTAASILVYAFDQARVFVETNIRTVYIHHFFSESLEPVSDKDILLKVQETLPDTGFRQWYWALMDYGVHLKKTIGNVSRKAKAYARQGTFQGSLRQARGAIISQLRGGPQGISMADLGKKLDNIHVAKALEALLAEGLIVAEPSGLYRLPGK